MLLRSFARCLGNRIFQFGLNLLTQFVLTLHFHPDEFGKFATLFSIVSLGNIVLSVRLPLQILQREECDMTLYWNASLQEGLWVLLILAGILLLFFPLSSDLLLLLLSGFLSRIVDFLRAAQKRLSGQFELLKTEHIVPIFSNITVLSCLLGGAGTILLSLRECIPSIIFIFLLYRGVSFEWKWINFSQWQSLFLQGRNFWIDNLFEHSFLRCSVLMIRWLGGETYAGHYYQAQRLILIPHIHFHSLITQHAFYLFSRALDKQESRKICKQLCLWTSCLLIPIALVLFYKGVDWGLLILKNDWIPMLEILEMMAAGLVFFSLFSIYRTYFLATNASRALRHSRIWQIVGFCIPCLVFSP